MKETKIANTTNWIQHLEFLILMVTMIDGIYSLDAKIERQSQRTDRLYEMFIDLVKEKK
jgi:hypothetical protein